MRVALTLLTILLAAYLALCAAMYWRQRELIYFPEYTRVDARDTDFMLARPGATLRGWRVHPGRPRALIYFGGNAETISHWRDVFGTDLPQHTIYLVAYRGYGASDGTPDESALHADALALFDAVRAEHEAVDVIGRSLGSGVAVRLAAQRPVERLIVITPYDSIARVAADAYPWLPVDWLLQDRFDAWRDAPQVRGEVLMLVAGADRVIPAPRSEALAAAFARAPRVLRIDAADHDSIGAHADARAALRAFLRAAG